MRLEYRGVTARVMLLVPIASIAHARNCCDDCRAFVSGHGKDCASALHGSAARVMMVKCDPLQRGCSRQWRFRTPLVLVLVCSFFSSLLAANGSRCAELLFRSSQTETSSLFTPNVFVAWNCCTSDRDNITVDAKCRRCAEVLIVAHFVVLPKFPGGRKTPENLGRSCSAGKHLLIVLAIKPFLSLNIQDGVFVPASGATSSCWLQVCRTTFSSSRTSQMRKC